MSEQTLQQKLDAQADVVDFLRNQQVGPNVYPGVPAEYSNWRNEQRAWAKSAVLFNQSYHMVELYVRGPEAFALLVAPVRILGRHARIDGRADLLVAQEIDNVGLGIQLLLQRLFSHVQCLS